MVWDAQAPDGYGQPTFAAAREVTGRWERRRRLLREEGGDPVWLDATFAPAGPVAEGSVLWEGTLEEWEGAGSGPDPAELFEVVLIDRVPDIKGRAERAELGLARYRGTPPGG